jgi:phosphomannomutase
MEKAKHPTTIAGQAVTATESLDGIKWHLGDTGWLLFRASGTEPVLRIYCEAQDDKAVQAILAQAKKLAGL